MIGIYGVYKCFQGFLFRMALNFLSVTFVFDYLYLFVLH